VEAMLIIASELARAPPKGHDAALQQPDEADKNF
jgi:hypothetical protein